jgi:hypothetical protein
VFAGASSGLAQVGFEFGEGHLDWIEVRAVGGQVVHTCAAGFDQGFDRSDFMGGQVVQNYDVAGAQFRAKYLLQICGKDLGVDRACDHRGALPVPMRHVRDAALVSEAASVQPGHLRVQPGLIDEDQSFAVQPRLVLTPAFPRRFHVGPFLLGGVQGLFYSSTPSAPAGATGPCGRSGF